jgi:drug/metabolite transporter (DMT)-like permease
LATGVLFAALAALAYEIGYVLQALGARAAPSAHPGAGLLASLVRQPTFLAGAVIGVLGFALQVLALRHAPLAIVQPILALGLIALLVLARVVLGERPGRREAAGALLVAAGAATVFAVAPNRPHAPSAGASYVLLALALVAASPFVLRARNGRSLVAAAAAADVLVALAGDRLGEAHSSVGVLGWGALAAGAALGAVTSESAALQRLPVVRVGPVILAAQAIVPVLLAGVVAGEALPGRAAAVGLTAGLATLGAGVALLASSNALARVMAPEAPAR